MKRALKELRGSGVRRPLLLTGDSERVAAVVAGELGLKYRAGSLTDDKIANSRDLQAEDAVTVVTNADRLRGWTPREIVRRAELMSS